MSNLLKGLGFYFITDSALSKRGISSDVRAALSAGCRIIQYREKKASTRRMLHEALAIKGLCQDKALLIINDRIDIALAADADGVHLGKDDMPLETARMILGRDMIIGISCSSVEDARKAEGADYLGIGPVFTTSTKKDADR